MKKKYIFIISLLLFLLLLFAFYYFILKKTKPTPIIKKIEETERIVIPARPKTFDEGRKVFSDTIKLAQIASLDNDQKNIKIYTNKALILWRDVLNEFINTPPKYIENKENWVNNLSTIFTTTQEAEQLLQNKKFQLAADKLDKSLVLLNEIKQAQTQEQTNNTLLPLLLSTKKITQAQTLSEAQKHLPGLKLNYTDIKNMYSDEKFTTLCQNFEAVISEIDNATKATFPRAQKKLMPAFLEIYKKY